MVDSSNNNTPDLIATLKDQWDSINIYANPRLNSAVGSIIKGQTYSVIDQNGNIYKLTGIGNKSGKSTECEVTGWCKGSYLNIRDRNESQISLTSQMVKLRTGIDHTYIYTTIDGEKTSGIVYNNEIYKILSNNPNYGRVKIQGKGTVANKYAVDKNQHTTVTGYIDRTYLTPYDTSSSTEDKNESQTNLTNKFVTVKKDSEYVNDAPIFSTINGEKISGRAYSNETYKVLSDDPNYSRMKIQGEGTGNWWNNDRQAHFTVTGYVDRNQFILCDSSSDNIRIAHAKGQYYPDQVLVEPYNNLINKNWTYYIRANDANVGNIMADFAKDVANNDHVGYSQTYRNTLGDELRNINGGKKYQPGTSKQYKPQKINKDVSTDCSAFMTTALEHVGLRPNDISEVSAENKNEHEYSTL